MGNLLQKPITEIVSENYAFASVLFYFDIRFFDYTKETLEEICKAKGLSPERVIIELERAKEKDNHPEFSGFPVDVIIEYLKHSHFIFAKRKLPYLSILIESLDCSFAPYDSITTDLKFVFPLFVKDFVEHVYEEEDIFFTYINELHLGLENYSYFGKIFCSMEKHNISKFAAEHDAQDDTMTGIRDITKQYYTDEHTPLHLKVIYNELKEFEKELKVHSSIENDILFPKALQLESSVKKLINDRIALN